MVTQIESGAMVFSLIWLYRISRIEHSNDVISGGQYKLTIKLFSMIVSLVYFLPVLWYAEKTAKWGRNCRFVSIQELAHSLDKFAGLAFPIP